MKYILPTILSLFTGPRYKPEIVWSEKSWTHNIFRFYELIFWRRFGIRKESSTWSYIENGKQIVKFELYTLEATLAHVETLIRNFRIKWLDVKIVSYQFATPVNTPEFQRPWINFTIALDVANTGANTTTSPLTWSHTTTGSNPFIAICSGATDDGSSAIQPAIGTVSYNSISATSAVTACTAQAAEEGRSAINFLGNPSTGANTVSVAFSGIDAPGCAAGAISYSGAQSSSTKDASNSTTGTTIGAKLVVVTTIADNCWVVGCAAVGAASGAALNTSLQTERWNIVAKGTFLGSGQTAGQDTNAAKTPAGTVSMGWTVAGTTPAWSLVGASFAPSAGTTINTINNLNLLGVT